MIIGTRVVFVLRAHESKVFNPCHIGGVRTRQHAAGKALLIQRQQLIAGDQFVFQGLKFSVAALAPMNLLRLRELGDCFYPGGDLVTHGRKRDVL